MLSSSSLDRFTCVALAGVAVEALRFGQAEGGLNDVTQLDGMLRALQVRCIGRSRISSPECGIWNSCHAVQALSWDSTALCGGGRGNLGAALWPSRGRDVP